MRKATRYIAAKGVVSQDAYLCRTSPTQEWMSVRHEVTSAIRETDSKAEPVHGSAKLCVVAVCSPEWVVPEGTSSGRALFFRPALESILPTRRPAGYRRAPC